MIAPDMALAGCLIAAALYGYVCEAVFVLLLLRRWVACICLTKPL
jgi:hypothetical protein